jgi:hypothetical protein
MTRHLSPFLIVICACAACGHGSAAAEQLAASDHGASVTVPAAIVTGGSPAQRRLLRRILGDVGRTRIRRVAIERGVLRMVGPASDRMTLWQGFVIGEAFRDCSARQGLAAVTTVVGPDGVGYGGLGARGDPPRHPGAAGRLAALVRAAAARSGGRLIGLHIVDADGPAANIALQTRSPARFLAHHWLRFTRTIARSPAARAGLLITLIGAHGRPAAWTLSATSIGGAAWIRPALAACDPLQIPEPSGYDPPACPASAG